RRSGEVVFAVPRGLVRHGDCWQREHKHRRSLSRIRRVRGHARGARSAVRIHIFAASRGFGGGADPFGRSNMPLGRLSKKASTSDVFTTSAYLAFMSQRLMAWLACERSKQPSSASAMREVRLEASSTVARTQPDVVVPVTITLSHPSSVR